MDLVTLINTKFNGNAMEMLSDCFRGLDIFQVPKLHEAVNKSDFQTVRAMIQNGANLNQKEPRLGFTPLFGAIINNNTRMLELLIREGANVNVRTNDQRTPLMLAIEMKKAEVVRVLVENGADVHAKDREGQSMFHRSVVFGSMQIVKFIIQHGVDINVLNASQETPLHVAINSEKTSIVKLLLAKGADVNAVALKDCKDSPTGSNVTPLLLAVVSGLLGIARILVNAHANVNARTSKKYTALHFAVKMGRFDLVEFLLEAGSDVNAQIDSGKTPLYIAVESNCYEIARLLLKHGASVDLKEKVMGATPLFLAVVREHEEFVKFLIENGANVNTMNGLCELPIHVAARSSNVKIAKELLWNGSYYSVEAQSNWFSGSPADLAQKSGNSKLVEMLALTGKLFNSVVRSDAHKLESCVRAGAAINARNVSGRTALHYAVSTGNIKAVNTLLANNAHVSYASNKGNLPLHIAVTNKNQEVVKILLAQSEKLSFAKRNFTVNAKTTGSGYSALHIAAKNNDCHAAQLLLANGAVYNAKNKAGKLPVKLTTDEAVQTLLISAENLFKAVKNEDSFAGITRILENDSSAVNARDADGGETLLHWSVSKGDSNITNMLLSNGADCCLITNKGTTPLHIAALKGNMEIVKMLVMKVKTDNVEKSNDFIDAATASGTVALHVASSLDIIKCLLEAGATYNIRDGEGKTASDLLQNQDGRKLLKTTHQTFEDVKKGICSWDSLSSDELKAIAGARNEQGQTLLQVANVRIAGKLSEKLKNLV